MAGTRRTAVLTIVSAVALLPAGGAAALDVVNYYSPRNRERPRRSSTEYIILHTTEAPKKGSLEKVHENGETHYFIDTGGRVYRIVDRRRVAFHAGRSMWDGRTNLDDCSIGIEMVGYHDADITAAQYRALKELLADLKQICRIPDERVLTHSMVAYGAPNRWHKHSHRGRKRCGMLFAKRSVRRRLGLEKQPLEDPDVKAGRLVVGDPYLAKVLYGGAREQETAESGRGAGGDVIAAGRSAWDIARDGYRSSTTVYVFPDGRRLRGNEIRDWKKMPPGTRVIQDESQSENEQEDVKEIGVHGDTAKDIAGDEYNGATTIYFMVKGGAKRGDELEEAELAALPAGTKILVGYTHGGLITAERSAFDVCGARWKFPSTFYMFPDGAIRSGDRVDENRIPRNTAVFFRN